ncbi:MAG: hypothetical protein JSS36_04210 [Proteobacteria bacterium]|nr:hypothetical protein [Pseudomonadota bacterium]
MTGRDLKGLRGWLARAPRGQFAVFAGAMAFGVYFAMFAFRKPFAVAAYAGMPGLGGLAFKPALVIAQVLGYGLAKAIGVKVIAELPARRRVAGITAQIAMAEVALVLFAILPGPWKVAALLLNGLALGMVWGMVFGFVEGRRGSELIGAMLCASFVLSSGVMKAVGQGVLLAGAAPFWMPAITGLIFAPLLALCLSGLALLPPPDAGDRAERVERAPMDGAARAAFLARYLPGLAGLVVVYVMVTALRDLRDNFAAEIWAELGRGGQPALFALTELPISLVVLGALAALGWFRSNRAAFAANLALVALGLVLAALASAAFTLGWLGPVAWMVLLGAGLYLAYTPFNGMLFDRLVAASGTVATAGFLIYVADTAGYGGTISLLLVKNFAGLKLDWVRFLAEASMAGGAVGLVLLGAAALWFRRALA